MCYYAHPILLHIFWGRFGFDAGYKTQGACRDGD